MKKRKKNIDKCLHLKICDLKLEDVLEVLRVSQKGKNNINIQFSNYYTANNLVENKFTRNNKGYKYVFHIVR